MPIRDLSVEYDKSYFELREQDADLREASYRQEFERMSCYINGGSVLEIGCGKGEFLQLFDDSWRTYGIEVSEYAKSIAKQNGVTIVDYDQAPGSFDLIVYRGTFQHLTEPVWSIQQSCRMLKEGGHLVFLATPNTNSLCYRLFSDLPALDPPRNFVLPSDIMLSQILENFGMTVLEIDYPYLGTPYASPVRDHLCFLLRLLGFKSRFAFWRNMMEIYAQKQPSPHE